MMSEIQNGLGATPERLKKSKIVTVETVNAGQFAQRDMWPDVVIFMLDREMLTPEHGYGWSDYQKLKCNTGGHGNGGDGFKQQEYIIFQKILGYKNLRILHELADYPVPGNIATESDIVWRLRSCLPLIRTALTEASKAAQEAFKKIEILKTPK